jgi:hypothetical protein
MLTLRDHIDSPRVPNLDPDISELLVCLKL